MKEKKKRIVGLLQLFLEMAGSWQELCGDLKLGPKYGINEKIEVVFRK